MSVFSGNYQSFIMNESLAKHFFDPEDLKIRDLPKVKMNKRCGHKQYYLDFNRCRHQPWLYFIRPDEGEELEVFHDIRTSDRRTIPRKDKIIELFCLLNCNPTLNKFSDRVEYLRVYLVLLIVITFLAFGFGLKDQIQEQKLSKFFRFALITGGIILNLVVLLIFQFWLIPKAERKFYNMRRMLVLDFSHEHLSKDSDMRIICPKKGTFFLMLYSDKNLPFLNKIYNAEDDGVNVEELMGKSAPLPTGMEKLDKNSQAITDDIDQSMFM